MQELLGYNILQITIGVVSVLSSCILAIAISWQLGLVVVFGSLPPVIMSGFARMRLELKLDRDVESRFAKSNAMAAEAISAIRTVASLSLESYVIAEYRKELNAIDIVALRSLVWTMFWYSLSSSMSFLSMALGFW